MLHLLVALTAAALAQDPPPRIDPPPVNEAALAARLLDMTKPSRGERAIILFDPTYYPGITTRLREGLHQLGIQTFSIAEDTPDMVLTYRDDDAAHDARVEDVVETLRPLFKRADIFYWMPIRGYGDDLRWERLVEESRVRSVHFHWLLPFPGSRTAEEIVAASLDVEKRSLEVDLADQARKQEMLAAALRGRTMRITTPAGTNLTLKVPIGQWFHFGNGDASKTRAAAARSIRDRQIELPVGGFHLVPEAEDVDGVVVAPRVLQSGEIVRDARFEFRRGRIALMSAASGLDWIRERIVTVGPDGDKIATLFFNTHPMAMNGVGIDVGSNWENGGTNRAVGMRRMSMRLTDADVTIEGRALLAGGRIQWDAVAAVARPDRQGAGQRP
jgi:Thermophilic metalloprotease (M29)